MRMLVTALTSLVLMAGASRATALNGAVDGLSNSGAAGWACASDPMAEVGIAAYAGPNVVGIYPRAVVRPDAAHYCPGANPAGFSIVFDAATQAMFSGQSQLSLRAISDGLTSRLLPSSNPVTFNPTPLPSGMLLGLRASSHVTGVVSASGGPPHLQLFAGGPANEGLGSQSGTGVTVAAGRYSLDLPVPGMPFKAAPGQLLPVFGLSTNAAGISVALANPLPLVLQTGVPQTGLRVAITGTAAQFGAVSGVTNTLLTNWMPAGTGFAGLSGAIIFSGNDKSFSEALVEVGTTTDVQSACLARNGQTPTSTPVMSRLWAGILKSNDTSEVAVPVNFALDHVVPPQAGGTCLLTWVSAGYPFLSASVARYSRTAVALQASLVKQAADAPDMIAFGAGGEFRSVPRVGPPGGVYVGVMAERAMTLDGIAGTASAAPVLGAPPATQWQMPAGYWTAGVTFVYLPAPACAAAHLRAQPANGPIAVLRNFIPIALDIPAGAVKLLAMPMSSRGAQAIQRSAFASFSPLDLRPGDCVVAYMSGDTGIDGALDVENQSTIYLTVK